MHCREHVVDVQEQIDLAAYGARAYVVGFDPERRARGWQRRYGIQLPFLLDPVRATYRAYGFGRSLWRSFHPQTLWSYARAVLRGEPLPLIRNDPTQLGGDVVVGTDRRVRLAFYSYQPLDRPALDELRAALDA